MGNLDTVANRQATLSVTANALKKTVERARDATLGLSIVGALAAAVAAALAHDSILRTPLTAFGAVCLAVVGAISGYFLGAESVRRHIRGRAASEALKREAYLYAAAASPYDDAATRDERLLTALDEVEKEIGDLVRFEVEASEPGSCPRGPLDAGQYMAQRVEGQIGYYTRNAAAYARISKRLHLAQWGLALVAAGVTALAGAFEKGAFDLAAITAVITTFAAALVARLEAGKYDELVSAYRGTARRLERLRGKGGASAASVAAEAEPIIAAETKGWAEMLAP